MRRSVVRSVVGGALLVLAAPLALVPGSATAGAPPGEVRVQGQAREGQYDTFTGTLRVRCAPGLRVTALGLTFTQDFTSPESPQGTLPSCDGRWQVLSYGSYEGFHPGPAGVDARMVLVDATTGEPRGEVMASGEVYVRPGARIRLPRTAQLRPGGVVQARVAGRCDEPWVLQDFLVSASQFEGYAYGSALLDIPCDGAYHARTVRLQSSGRTFARGWVRLDASISTLDAVNFDPAVGASASRAVRVG